MQSLWNGVGRHVVRYRRAFTIVELLIVMTIIAILVAMLLPSLRRARALARRVQCASNQHSIGIGNEVYFNDFNRWMLTFNGGMDALPNASSAISNSPFASRSYWKMCWPDEARWCPDVARDRDVRNPTVTGLTWSPRWDYNQYLMFGYNLPAVDTNAVKISWEKVANEYASVYGLEYYYADYIKPEKLGVARYNYDGSLYLYYGRQWDPYGTKPMANCLYAQAAGGTRWVSGHNYSDDGKSSANPGFEGGNSLWLTGHVEWHDFKGPISGDYRAVATRYGIYVDEGWTLEYPSILYYYWAKPARR